jgi:hypothetical protein
MFDNGQICKGYQLRFKHQFKINNPFLIFIIAEDIPTKVHFNNKSMELFGDWRLTKHLLDSLTTCFGEIQAIELCKHDMFEKHAIPRFLTIPNEIQYTIRQIFMMEERCFASMPKFVLLTEGHSSGTRLILTNKYFYTMNASRWFTNTPKVRLDFKIKRTTISCKYRLKSKRSAIFVQFCGNRPAVLVMKSTNDTTTVLLHNNHTILRHLMETAKLTLFELMYMEDNKNFNSPEELDIQSKILMDWYTAVIEHQ